MPGWLYMMADRYRGTIYTGVTADIRPTHLAAPPGPGLEVRPQIRTPSAGLCRTLRAYRERHRPREGDQKMAVAVEDRADREGQSGLARLDRAHHHRLRERDPRFRGDDGGQPPSEALADDSGDLAGDELLDDLGEVAVEPLLEHRLQH